MTGAIIVMLIVCGVFFYLAKKKDSEENRSEKEKLLANSAARPYAKDELRIENVGPGGLIHVSGIGANMSEFDIKILAKHLYRDDGSSWYELEGESTEGKVWIDLEEDDELILNITLKKLKLQDVGLSKKDLERIDDEEEGELNFEGETYYYEDSDRAVFYRFGDESAGEPLYYWDFENETGDRFIGIEKWEDGGFDVSYSEPIQSHQVTVFSLTS